MKTIKLAVLAALSFVCTAQVQAQTTNLVQNLSIQLFGFSQGGVSHFGSTVTTNVNIIRVDTRQIIQVLGAATGNSFSFFSKLVTLTPINGGSPSVQVRDGSNAPVDVTDFFVLQALTDSVDGSVLNTKTHRGTSISYEVDRFALRDAHGATLSLHFDVNGVSTSNSSTPQFGPQGSTLDSNVSGSGDRNGNLLILQGSVDIFGRSLEVDDGGFTGVS